MDSNHINPKEKRFMKMRKRLDITEGIFPMPVLMVATYNEDGSVNVMNAAWADASNDIHGNGLKTVDFFLVFKPSAFSPRFYTFIDQPIDDFRLIRIGIMSGILDPFDGNAGILIPCLIVSDTRSGLVFFTADQQRRAFYFIRQCFLYCLSQHLETMS